MPEDGYFYTKPSRHEGNGQGGRDARTVQHETERRPPALTERPPAVPHGQADKTVRPFCWQGDPSCGHCVQLPLRRTTVHKQHLQAGICRWTGTLTWGGQG